MNAYKKAVKWLKENYKVEGTEDELDFMREKAHTVHHCKVCIESQEPFWHLVASIVCNPKNESLAEKLSAPTKIYPPLISAAGWVHLVDLTTDWRQELEKLKMEGKIQ